MDQRLFWQSIDFTSIFYLIISVLSKQDLLNQIDNLMPKLLLFGTKISLNSPFCEGAPDFHGHFTFWTKFWDWVQFSRTPNLTRYGRLEFRSTLVDFVSTKTNVRESRVTRLANGHWWAFHENYGAPAVWPNGWIVSAIFGHFQR